MNFARIKSLTQEAASLTAQDMTDRGADFVKRAHLDFVERTGCNADSFSVALTSGLNEYSLVTLGLSNVISFITIGVAGATGGTNALQPIDAVGMVNERDSGSTATGTPGMFTILGFDKLQLWPTPGAGMTLKGVANMRPAAMAADADLPDAVPEEFHDAIWFKATELAKTWDQQSDASEWRQRYEVELERAARRLNRNHGRAPRRLVPSVSLGGSPLTMWDRMGR